MLGLWHIDHCRLFNDKSSLWIYIKYIWFGSVRFYGISIIIGYLMPDSLYRYISNIYDLVGLGFNGISTIVGYLMTNPIYTLNILNIIYIKSMGFGLVGFYGMPTIVGYLMPNPLYIYIYIYIYIWFVNTSQQSLMLSNIDIYLYQFK